MDDGTIESHHRAQPPVRAEAEEERGRREKKQEEGVTLYIKDSTLLILVLTFAWRGSLEPL